MIGHLGSRASALLDGRLSAEEEDRAWEHVHTCHACRDLVEREGWIKTQLAGFSLAGSQGVPSGLKQRLLTSCDPVGVTPWEDAVAASRRPPLAVLAGGAVGTAMLGVLALGVAPASAPTTTDRRLPTGSIGGTLVGPRLPAATLGTTRSRQVEDTRPSRTTTVSVKMAR